ncbi:uncharacterized protein LOC144435143 [Glandiceps talaboti]
MLYYLKQEIIGDLASKISRGAHAKNLNTGSEVEVTVYNVDVYRHLIVPRSLNNIWERVKLVQHTFSVYTMVLYSSGCVKEALCVLPTKYSIYQKGLQGKE